jgi:hypothetical protein
MRTDVLIDLQSCSGLQSSSIVGKLHIATLFFCKPPFYSWLHCASKWLRSWTAGRLYVLIIQNISEGFAKTVILSKFKASPPAGGWNGREAVQKGLLATIPIK